MTRSRIASISGAVVSLLALASQASGQEATLRLKFREGEVQKVKMAGTMSFSQGEVSFSMQLVFYMTKKTKKIEGDVATIETRCTRVTGKMRSPMGGEDITYDSDKDDPSLGMMFQNAGAMVGKTTLTKLDALGNVLETKAVGEGAEAAPENELQKVMQMIGTQLPKDAVKAGFEWKQDTKTTLPRMGEVTTKIANKITSVEGDLVKSSFEGTIDITQKKPAEGTQTPEEAGEDVPPPFKDVKFTGTTEFDHARGVHVRKTAKVSMTMNLMGSDVPIDIDQTEELLKVLTEEETKETKEGPGK